MTKAPFMPKATAVWLVENTTLTFKQIAEFCNLHELEIKGIADGDVAKGIKAYNPILAGQLSREEIELCSKDPSKIYLKKLRKLKSKREKNLNTHPYQKDKIDLMQYYGYAKMHRNSQTVKFLNLWVAPRVQFLLSEKEVIGIFQISKPEIL